ncbi:hypothetical protein EC844_1378 [Acinetobacter calcoaceticus]|uniref:Uncharacterized protein n=1 Tax=Acinetobacter calcoaceticus TaxID=471 RepID=A0A4V2QZ90_ACICA|nr:hypothetical protein EC844_1378 [Acinetobacter calcoaceticus]
MAFSLMHAGVVGLNEIADSILNSAFGMKIFPQVSANMR